MRRERSAELRAEVARELAPLSVQLPEPSANGAGRLFRPLFNARIREFRGELDGRGGAKFAYLAARPSEQTIRRHWQRAGRQSTQYRGAAGFVFVDMVLVTDDVFLAPVEVTEQGAQVGLGAAVTNSAAGLPVMAAMFCSRRLTVGSSR